MSQRASAGGSRDGAFEYLTTKKDEFVGWARKFSLFPYPFVTACCAMEFMSVSSTLYDTDRFGAALPRFTPRQSDLLMVVGTIAHKQAPILKKVYEQMCEPKWVIAFGGCATSGGFYQNYAALPGIDDEGQVGIAFLPAVGACQASVMPLQNNRYRRLQAP